MSLFLILSGTSSIPVHLLLRHSKSACARQSRTRRWYLVSSQEQTNRVEILCTLEKNRLTDKWSVSFTKHTSDQLPCFDKVNINTLNRCQLFTSVFLFCFYAQKAEKESAGSFFCNYVWQTLCYRQILHRCPKNHCSFTMKQVICCVEC